MASETAPDIIYTKVDEAPQLASASLLPIIRVFTEKAGISIGVKDISLAGRIIAAFPERLTPVQKLPDDLAELGELVKNSRANVIKLPNISASVPQLVAAITELKSQGYDLPDYPEEPVSDTEKSVRSKYDAIKGSAVNPVLREGNSDRRAAVAVKKFAAANPHSMGVWSKDSKTRVSTMTSDDFRSNETSVTLSGSQAGFLRIEHVSIDKQVTVLKDSVELPTGTVVDATFMSAKALDAFLVQQIEETKADGTLFSLHLKATMMKISDPILFGHAVTAYLKPIFKKYMGAFDKAGVDPNSGLGSLYSVIEGMPNSVAIRAEIDALMETQPPLYMVNSDKGITNLHVPSDVIIDASMPALIRAGGKGWGPDGRESDANCVIPDSSYAAIYDEAIKFCKENGAVNPTSVGTVQNVGLMAQKAEEYGSHPTTFEVPSDGKMRVIGSNGDILHEHSVESGDIWRMASTRKAAIENWVQLAIERQDLEGCEAIFWLDEYRAHDLELIKVVTPMLDVAGCADNFSIMAPREATRVTFETTHSGRNSIAITGNVLRDYLTDLFPILELGTSAKMLSIVKLMNGGGLFETGAGGSAPKHVEQLLEKNHLRWDSLGEFCALGESLKYFGLVNNNPKATILGAAVDAATQGILDHNKSPGRKVGQLDNRDSHFFFALYWAQAIVEQNRDFELATYFAPLAEALLSNQDTIIDELRAGRGTAVDLGGYYHSDVSKTGAVMAPSETLNNILLKSLEFKSSI
ncbi:MAG: NADP-dependent isocitrate dehydrogenase [Tateyamaria sp.]|jgi:isocitrate dehydrogenase|nr:NADP-dependent isocitrate dehydrogenase [Tateyamaria sp.]MBT5302061.1 NADP-dependent isocitrate dehydrogenase [Tateyamaria sp.]MBT6266484.1 NADP-dependent isocitrate dehydrogenase [Tateyamaria sp.]MBT6342551.1 NADP-dependent isocitrate dehydrogenase [Tateyamaria sp.]MBT7448001.1 NADP-dependent isocitrate dehydrogenase [Tateyamaria sp.]